MGTMTGQLANPTITCMICGRQNATDRKYCENCKQRLHDPAMDKLRVSLQSAQEENLRLAEKHESVQLENQQLRQQIDPLQQEEDRLKVDHVDPEHVAALTDSLHVAEKNAADLNVHATGLESKWKSAEQRAANLEAKLVAKVKEVETIFETQHATPAPEHIAALQASQEKAADLELHATGVESKWKVAEQKVADLKAELAVKVEELGNFHKRIPDIAAPEHVAALTGSLQVAEEKATVMESRAADLNGKLKSTEQQVAELQAKLARAGRVVNPWLKYVFGGITFVGSLGGYSAGRYVRPKDDSAVKTNQVNQLMTQQAAAQQQIETLTLALNAANAKADQVQVQSKADLDSANQKNSDVATRQLKAQRQLSEAIQKASTADQNEKQSKMNLEAANRKINELSTSGQQLQRELTDAYTQRTSASQTIAQLNADVARLHTQTSPTGSLVWSGNLSGKRTIEIKNGVPDFGALSGSLPQKSCKLSTQDAHVKIKGRPSKNHLNDFSFEVTGSGLVQVKIQWELAG